MCSTRRAASQALGHGSCARALLSGGVQLPFGLVVRRPRDPRRASFIVGSLAFRVFRSSGSAVPFAVAPAAIALGLRGKGRLAIAAIGIGVLVLLLVTGAYAYSAVDKLT